MKPIPLRQASTAQLVELVRQQAAKKTRLGADPPEDHSTPQDWGTVQDWTNYAIDLLYAPGERWRMHVRNELGLTATQLTDWGMNRITKGAVTAGNVAVEMGRRAGEASAALADGIGKGFRAFWGFSPGEGLAAAAVLGLVVVGAGVFLLTTPGGQALFFGSAHGYQAMLSGMGQSFPVLARTAPAALPATVHAASDALPATVQAIGVIL